MASTDSSSNEPDVKTLKERLRAGIKELPVPLTNSELATRLGRSKNTVAGWRRVSGLPVKADQFADLLSALGAEGPVLETLMTDYLSIVATRGRGENTQAPAGRRSVVFNKASVFSRGRVIYSALTTLEIPSQLADPPTYRTAYKALPGSPQQILVDLWVTNSLDASSIAILMKCAAREKVLMGVVPEGPEARELRSFEAFDFFGESKTLQRLRVFSADPDAVDSELVLPTDPRIQAFSAAWRAAFSHEQSVEIIRRRHHELATTAEQGSGERPSGSRGPSLEA